MKLKEVLSEVLERISPSPEFLKELKSLSGEFVSLLSREGLEARIGGSLAKGTIIKKELTPGEKIDIDIFVVFDNEEDTKKLGEILKKIRLPGKVEKVHGSRDYFRVSSDKAVVELVPVVKKSKPEEAQNVTDVSLDHVKYVVSKLKKNPELSNEIRLAKAFCIAQRCYGAESYIHGFSGYAIEVLVIYFGGFIKFLKGIKKKKIIDPEKHFKNEREILNEVNASKLNSPVILIDPTYKYRNVCAGLGFETFDKFLNSAEKFLKRPSKEFFEKKEINIEKIKKFAKTKKAKFVEIDLKTDRQEGDIAGTKMKKLLDFFSKELERNQQNVLLKEFDYKGKGKKAKGYLVVKEKSEIEIRGPLKYMEDSIKQFKKNKKNVFVKGKYVWHKKKTGVREVFEKVKKVEKEMGAQGEIKIF